MSESHQYNLSHSVLGIPELLSLTFSYASHRTLANCARVCKSWMDPALNELWKVVDNPIPAFRLLAPLLAAGDGYGQRFSRGITAEDWPRFQFYAKRIRSLTCHSNNGIGSQTIDSSVFEDIARSRLQISIWPNLKHLDLEVENIDPTQVELILLQKGLQSLTLAVSTECYDLENENPDESLGPMFSASECDQFFVELLTRAPSLTSLCLRMNARIPQLEARVIKYLSSLRSLRKLAMPPFSYTSDVVTALARLPDLRTCEFVYRYNPNSEPLPASRQRLFHPKLQEGAFPVLRDLSLHDAFDNIAKFFVQSFAPTNLTDLYISSPFHETAESFASCLKVLADSCQLLSSLWSDMETSAGSTSETRVRISYQELAILKGLPNLKNFELVHTLPVSLTNEELGELVSSWPSLESLNLNSNPSVDSGGLTLACLLPLAQHCPNLRTLGLYINATVPVKVPISFKSFVNLEELDIGASRIKDTHMVSIFLSHLCSSRTTLLWESSKREPYRTRWKLVSGFIPLLLTLKSEEKERSDALQKELEDLRIRAEVMEDQLKLLKGLP